MASKHLGWFPSFTSTRPDDAALSRADDVDDDGGVVVETVDQVQEAQESRVDVAKLVADELNRLSVQEREHVYEEIHGVDTLAVPETPELVEAASSQFHIELLTGFTKEETHAYDYALQNNFQFVHQPDFQIKFLRYALFDAKVAAARFLRYLNLLLKLFGPVALQRPLRLDDLNAEDLKYLKMGFFQLLPSRDRAGRRLIVNLMNIAAPVRVRIKGYMYVMSELSNDVPTQRLGCVFIMSAEQINIKDALRFRDKESKLWGEYYHSMLVRIGSIHGIAPPTSPSLAWKIAEAVYFRLASQELLVRLRFHRGTLASTETRYTLMSYGIPVDDLPVTVPTSSAKNKNHLQWLKGRANFERLLAESNLGMPQESSTSDGQPLPSTSTQDHGWESFQQQHLPTPAITSARSSSSSHSVSANNGYPIHAVVDCPGIRDVLFYNGGKAWPHEGNVSFVNLLEKALPLYNETTPGETNKETTERKRSVIRHIIRTVEGPPWNGRFLSWQENEGWWIDMIAANSTATSSTASRSTSTLSPLEVKVRRAILDHNRRLAANKKRQESSSSTMKFASMDGGGGTSRQRKRMLENSTDPGFESIDQEPDGGSGGCCNVGGCQKKLCDMSFGSPASAPGESPTNMNII
jgi:hypothetical protein